MAAAMQERLFAALPADLQAGAVDLSEEGAAEYAFPIENSLRVLEILGAQGFEVVGGDLWAAVADGFSSSHEGWFVESSEGNAILALRKFLSTGPRGDGYYMTFVARQPG